MQCSPAAFDHNAGRMLRELSGNFIMSGKRRHSKRGGISRRAFLRGAGFATASLGGSLIAACSTDGGGDSPQQVSSVSFMHGVASGDPLTDRVILWTRATPAGGGSATLDWTIASDPELSSVIQRGSVQTDASRDYTAKVDVTGLQPATTYYYRFSGPGGAQSPVGRTRTLPTGSVDRLRFGVCVCASLAHGYFNAYRRLAERSDLHFVMHLGDYIYEYGSGEYGDARAYEPPHEIITLDDYRKRHAQYKRDADLQALHRQHALVAIWDDHEFADNAWKGGAVNHQPSTEGDWNTRVGNALQAYYEWMPVRMVNPQQPRRNNRSFSIGDLAEVHLLEERIGARDQQVDANGAIPGGPGVVPTFTQTGEFADESRQLLGADEEQWLFGKLAASKARWQIIGQGVMFAQLKLVGAPNGLKLSEYLNNDQWDGYAPARQRVFDALASGGAGGASIDNVVILTGDIHTSWAADLTPDPNNALRYNRLTGEGSRAVEFVCTSVTSPGLEALDPFADVLKLQNPHFKYIDLKQKGYMLVDVTGERVQGEWWYVDTIAAPSANESYAAGWLTTAGSKRLSQASEATDPITPAPMPAP